MRWFRSEPEPEPVPPTSRQRIAYIWAVISEIRMLMDFVAGSSTRTLADLRIADKQDVNKFRPPGEVLLDVDILEKALSDPDAAIAPGNLADIQTLRDAIGQLVRPASGLSIAYTALVTGNRRSRMSDSRAGMAARAYPGLVRKAAFHRGWQAAVLIITLFVMSGTVWESTKVALGKSLLQNLDFLRPQQANIYVEKTKLEVAIDKPDGAAFKYWASRKEVPLAAYALCDRPRVLASYLSSEESQVTDGKVVAVGNANIADVPLYGSPQERDVCERDRVLATNFRLVHEGLNRYREDWPAMVGMSFGLIRDTINWLLSVRQIDKDPGVSPTSAAAQPPKMDDVEFMVAPVLLVWGNYVLPVLFSFLGSAIYVILDYSGKLRDSMLHPKDLFLSLVRLVLGIVTGATIGLFFSSYGPVQQIGTTASAGALISSLTLTASGVAFLAGFGVEGVFTMLEAMVSRVFAVQNAPK